MYNILSFQNHLYWNYHLLPKSMIFICFSPQGDLETLDDSEVIFPNVAPDYRTKTAEVKEEVKVEEVDETSRYNQPEIIKPMTYI